MASTYVVLVDVGFMFIKSDSLTFAFILFCRASNRHVDSQPVPSETFLVALKQSSPDIEKKDSDIKTLK